MALMTTFKPAALSKFRAKQAQPALKRAKRVPKNLGRFLPVGSLLGNSIQVAPTGSIEIVISCSFSVNPMRNSVLGKSLLEIGDHIAGVLKPHRNPNRARVHARSLQLRCIHSVVRCVLWEHNE